MEKSLRGVALRCNSDTWRGAYTCVVAYLVTEKYIFDISLFLGFDCKQYHDILYYKTLKAALAIM